MRKFLAFLGLCFLSACIIGEVPLDNKSCPCTSTYVCDETRNICVRRPIDYDGGAPDLGLVIDARPMDAIVRDADPPDIYDAGIEDAEPEDTGAEDAGNEDADARIRDALPRDMGVDTGPDTGPVDTGPVDTGPVDTGPIDTGPRDTGIHPDAMPPPPDTGVPDAAAPGTILLGEDCVYHEECETRLCLPLSFGPQLTICTRPCGSTSDCPIGFSCQFENWMSFCMPERAYMPAEVFQTESSSTCAAASEVCQSGICDPGSSTCVERCTSQDDCTGFGGNCYNSLTYDFANICEPHPGNAPTGAACASYLDCQSGLCLFPGNECISHCCSNVDCAPGYYCGEYGHPGQGPIKACLPRGAGGTSPLGTICGGANTCDSRVCASDNAGFLPPRVCTLNCCEDTDCAPMGAGWRCWPFVALGQPGFIGRCVRP